MTPMLQHYSLKNKQVQDLPLPSTFLSRLDDIIESNLQDEYFSIETLCKKLAISYSHAYRKIRQETGLSPSMYVCKKRLERAGQLLTETDLNIREIAFGVGFNTQAYFSKYFSDTYGYSPLQYRKKWKQGEDCLATI